MTVLLVAIVAVTIFTLMGRAGGFLETDEHCGTDEHPEEIGFRWK